VYIYSCYYNVPLKRVEGMILNKLTPAIIKIANYFIKPWPALGELEHRKNLPQTDPY
jgi:hypothetical protein